MAIKIFKTKEELIKKSFNAKTFLYEFQDYYEENPGFSGTIKIYAINSKTKLVTLIGWKEVYRHAATYLGHVRTAGEILHKIFGYKFTWDWYLMNKRVKILEHAKHVRQEVFRRKEYKISLCGEDEPCKQWRCYGICA